MNRRNLLKLAAFSIGAFSVGGGWWYRRSHQILRSAVITGQWSEISAPWLLPELKESVVQVPDRPCSHAEVMSDASRAAIHRIRTFTVSTGKMRLRSGDPAPQPVGQRLVAIGDSVTFGWGVSQEQSWPAQVALALKDKGVEVLNAGVPAQQLDAMKAWLVHKGPELKLSGILFGRRPEQLRPDPYNHYQQVLQEVQRALPGVPILVVLAPISRFDPRGMANESHETASLQSVLGTIPSLNLHPVLEAAKGQKGCMVRSANGKMQIVRLETGETIVEAPATAQDLPQAFYEALEEDSSIREALFFDDGHPEAEGLALMGQAVAEKLRGLGWV